MKCSILLSLFAVLLSTTSFAIERRSEQFPTLEGHYVLPVIGRVSGVGVSYGGAVGLLNIAGTDTDFAGYYITGDAQAYGASLANFHVIPEFLIVGASALEYTMQNQRYARGTVFETDHYAYNSRLQGYGGSARIEMWKRRVQLKAKYRDARVAVEGVFDQDGNEFKNADDELYDAQYVNLGVTLDFTDDYLDPRKGLRLRYVHSDVQHSNAYRSQYAHNSYAADLYLPIRSLSTWAFHFYRSESFITKKATIDTAALRNQLSLNCGDISDPELQASCQATEDERVAHAVLFNQYGEAEALGGPQRLRSFPLEDFGAHRLCFMDQSFA
jgi:hypothetical protein